MSQIIIEARKKAAKQQKERENKRVKELRNEYAANKMYENKLYQFFIKWREARIKRDKKAKMLKILILNKINGLDENGPSEIISSMLPYE
tara:strand:- start:5083 stop:5352 length:270 start_codon:yes stop_codon:yes gene_type:complete